MTENARARFHGPNGPLTRCRSGSSAHLRSPTATRSFRAGYEGTALWALLMLAVGGIAWSPGARRRKVPALLRKTSATPEKGSGWSRPDAVVGRGSPSVALGLAHLPKATGSTLVGTSSEPFFKVRQPESLLGRQSRESLLAA